MIERRQFERAALAMALSASAAVAHARFAASQLRPATAIELRAAYCVVVMKAGTNQIKALLPSESQLSELKSLPPSDPQVALYNRLIETLDRSVSSFNRLNNYYVLTLTGNVDPTGLLMARAQAAQDIARVNALEAAANCPSLVVDPTMACWKAVGKSPEMKDISQHTLPCGNPSWLPF